ncbi:hypothetical protein Gogos_012720 [Gossypium gossypioides]|uniref:Uncharacterized protein n=1 Tax=Gossypium gossypioides TaxID=34282 RepID=A0A7J9BTC7_GOSGO|nr:hypothetical protein [Gossypium gossypioides]
MKREGRQHGMVRTYRILPSPWNPNPESRFVQQFVRPQPPDYSPRPRCLGCHMHPTCKSKDKSKGSHKLRSREMVTSYRLITWRVVDGRHGLKDSEFSASRILDHLSDHYDDDDDECVVDDGFKVNSQEPLGEMEHYKGEAEENIIVDHNKDDDDDVKKDGVYVDYDDDDVRFVLDQDLEEEGWCLVGDD